MTEAPEPGRPKYRPDIDGLRGVAVLAVVLYHAFPETVMGGFIGVDVFFVISGFLITTIILGALERGTFRFAEFYARRVRRILPALIVTLLAVALAGWFLFTAREYEKIGRHLVAGTTFTSNFLLRQEIGYFDVEAERKALLHLWSLAIEEQFYFFFPLLLWLAHARRARPLLVTSTIALASFAWNILAQDAGTRAGFYSPLMRAWELMLGAMVASAISDPPVWLTSWRAKTERWLAREGRGIRGWPEENVLGHIVSIAGAYILIVALRVITKGDPFPGWYALLPTLAAAMLIASGATAWFNRRVLANRALAWFGLISFPLYLFHWPLLSIARVAAGEPLSWAWKLALVAAAILLAWLTYLCIERPMRSGAGGKRAVIKLFVMLASLGVIGFSITLAGGFVSRPMARTYDAYMRSVRFGDGGCVAIEGAPEGFCRIGDPATAPLAFVYGDSHAGVLRPAFAAYARERGRSFIYAGVSPPLLGVMCGPSDGSSTDGCADRNRTIFEYVKAHGIPNVILAARWTNYGPRGLKLARSGAVPEEVVRDGLEETIKAYQEIGTRVSVIVDNPEQLILPEDILRQSDRLDDEAINRFAISSSAHEAWRGWMAELLKVAAGTSTEVLDFTRTHCPEDICPLVKDGRFLYADHDHLSVDGAMRVYPELKKALDRL